MKCRLSEICEYGKGKVDVAALDKRTYISTENMLPNKGGIARAASLPTVKQTQAFFAGDVLVSNIRPYFKKIWFAEFNGGCSNDVLVFRARKGISGRFLYYVLADDRFFEFSMASSKGTKMPRGDKAAIMEYGVPNLTPAEQEKIVGILEALDRKIEINNDINENLMEQALCQYSVLISDDRKKGCIGDYCNVKSGYAFKSSWWQNTGIPVVKIGSINQDHLNLTSCSFVSESKMELAKDFIVSGGDLLIAMTGATIGKFTMVPITNKPILVNQRVGKFFLGDQPIEALPFIYCTLKQPDIALEIINRGQGSAQPNISALDIMSIHCIMPQQKEIEKFNYKTSPMFKTIIHHQYTNTMLTITRDTLLPRLMSGELDVCDLDL